jgi:DNA-binding LacI/PurR family transcriptional regulator
LHNNMSSTDRRPGPGPARRPATTLAEVARAAGVSTATVSRVVHSDPRISPDARQSVEAVVRRLGYVPNRSARSLAARRTDTIGFAVLEHPTRLFGDPYFPLIVSGVVGVLEERGLDLVLYMPRTEDSQRRLVGNLAAGSVDGVLVFGHHRGDPLAAELHRLGIPLVLFGRPLDRSDMSYVDIDHVGAAHAVTRHLIDGGRRVVATIAAPQDSFWGVDRLAGYHAERAEHGLAPDPALVEVTDFTFELGREAMLRLLGRRQDIDAVFAANDDLALGALAGVRAAGRRVPDDVAIVGFDDLPATAVSDPPLSSVRQPAELIGRELATMLLARISATEWSPRHLVLATELVVRASSAPARRPT